MRHLPYLLALILPLNPAFAQQKSEVRKPPKELIGSADLAKYDMRKNGIVNQPNGPFAAMIFDESALGTHFCILYYKSLGGPFDGEWDISERAWCSKKWGANITSLYWCPDGKCLYVGTNLVYGDGGVFRLDLLNKTYRKVYPPTDLQPSGKNDKIYVSDSEIVGVSGNSINLNVHFSKIVDDKEQPAGEQAVVIPLTK